jgi:hypothetical protein
MTNYFHENRDCFFSAKIATQTPWTAEEQKLLEQALKTYPASLGAERWDKVSIFYESPFRAKKVFGQILGLDLWT